MRILLVDDSGTMRAIQNRCLAKLGIVAENVIEAENGQVAFDKFSSEPFDLIMTDWNMPVMDGLTFLKKIRSVNTQIPVIMVTTEAERTRVVTAIEAGVSDYLVKPFTTEALNVKIEKWVPSGV